MNETINWRYGFEVRCNANSEPYYAGFHPTEGTLEDAITLAKELRATIILIDDPGFARGQVEADGMWRLT